ncbi:MAG: apolipoprotein N-acyltransferase, partial [Proteobacteria bacterium]|nr:apolipoprotein N-acyltransferase [Pseudomonadota bacterium]
MNKRVYGFSILSAALYVLASPPIDLEFIGFFCLTPLLFAIKESKSTRHALGAGLGSGLVATVGLYYWLIHTMTTYGGLSYPLSILLFLILVAYLSL